jgi:hypothetical protein
MLLALFGIKNGGLNLFVNLVVLFLVAVYIALIAWTYFDAKRRVGDNFLVICATLGALIPFIGAAIYAIIRPPEYLEDAREREIETRAAELRVRQLEEQSCPNCSYPIERTYLRCPSAGRGLRIRASRAGSPSTPAGRSVPTARPHAAGPLSLPAEWQPRRLRRGRRPGPRDRANAPYAAHPLAPPSPRANRALRHAHRRRIARPVRRRSPRQPARLPRPRSARPRRAPAPPAPPLLAPARTRRLAASPARRAPAPRRPPEASGSSSVFTAGRFPRRWPTAREP